MCLYDEQVVLMSVVFLTWMWPPLAFSPGSNACVSRPCSLLCLPRANNSKSCRCPEGVSSTVLPSGDLMCDCPQGYQRENSTCIKEGASLLLFYPPSSSPLPVLCVPHVAGLLKLPRVRIKSARCIQTSRLRG